MNNPSGRVRLQQSLTCTPFYLGFKWKKNRRTKTRRKIFYWLFKKENFRKKNCKDFWNIHIFFEEIKFSGLEKNFFMQYQLLHFYFEKIQFDMLAMEKKISGIFCPVFQCFFSSPGFYAALRFFLLSGFLRVPPPPFSFRSRLAR